LKKLLGICIALLWAFNVQANEINMESLNLSDEQNQKLTEMKANLRAEIQPIWEEIQAGRERITEIEKKYFEEFWNMLTDEQKKKFTELNQ